MRKEESQSPNLAGDRPVTVAGAVKRLVQVFANLMTNAAKYTDPGGEIALTLTPRGMRQAAVSITANGIGMPRGAIADLFEPFVQAPGAASNAEGGLGLGLAIVREIVLDHGGDVVAESQGMGMGSQFTVILPSAPIDVQQPSTPAAATASARQTDA